MWVDADGHRVWPMSVRSPVRGIVDGWKRVKGSWGCGCYVRGMFNTQVGYEQELAFEVCECDEARGAHDCSVS